MRRVDRWWLRWNNVLVVVGAALLAWMILFGNWWGVIGSSVLIALGVLGRDVS